MAIQCVCGILGPILLMVSSTLSPDWWYDPGTPLLEGREGR